MATVNVRITEDMRQSRYIDTTAGRLFFNVINIPEPVNDGDSVSFLSDKPVYKVPSPISIISYNNVQTPFTYNSEYGRIEYLSNGLCNFYDANNVLWFGGFVKSSGTGTAIGASLYIFIASNGNAYVTSNPFTSYSISDSTDYVSPNTSSTLGVLSSSSTLKMAGSLTASRTQRILAEILFGGSVPVPSANPDPYTSGSGGHSGGGGGKGRFSRTGDTIGEHNVPTLSATDAGFITLFAPTAGEMKALASYLWSDLFSFDTFKKIFANPMDAILGLSIVPVSVPTSGSVSVKVGNISTGVSMTKASTQYVKLSCGSLEIEEYWGAYLDYSPYTKCEIYLPYIGVHELSVDDVMGKTVKVVYYIDILSGACTAEIYSNSTCLYSFVGQCSASIPITGNDWTNVINGVMQIGASIGSMVASGGLTAPISAGGVAQGLKSVASASSTVTSSKPSVERSGSMSGAGGMLGQQTPYLIITWPRECIPADQNKYIGYPSYVTVNLGDIVGFNIVDSIHLENIPATSAELDEIESLLMNGVIF